MRENSTTVNLELAGFVNDRGHVTWTGDPYVMSVPKLIKLDSTRLLWKEGELAEDTTITHASEKLLSDFLALGQPGSEPKDILQFAQRWGPLRTCKHYRCSTHNQECKPRRRGSWFWEPLHVWRKASLWVAAVLKIAAELNSARPGRWEDWIVVANNPNEVLGSNSPILNARQMLMVAVERFVNDGDVRPQLRWVKQNWRILIQPGTSECVGGVLACQLLTAVTKRQQGLAVCSECSVLYTPARKPRFDRENFCPSCGRRAALRRASYRYRLKHFLQDAGTNT